MTESIIKAVIPKGQTMSGALDTRSGRLVRVGMPMDWTDAPLTVELSPDNNQWAQLVDRDGKPYIGMVVAKTVVLLDAARTCSLGWIRFRSGLPEKPIVQADNREFTLIMWSGA